MTYRDPAPERPECPVCDSVDAVQRHTNEHQGRFLCLSCMLLFDGTSAEYVKPADRPREDITDQLKAARAVLKEAAGRGA